MELSLYLAKLLGLYLVIVCLALLLNRKKVEELKKYAAQNTLFIFSFGAVSLLMGLAIVLAHNVWDTIWQSLITLLGYVAIVKGLLRLFLPEKLSTLNNKLNERNIIVWGIFWLIIGFYLTYVGFAVKF